MCILFIFMFLVHGFEKQISVFSKNYLPNFAQQITTDAICEAVEAQIDELNLSYSDLAELNYDDLGTVKSVKTNSPNINLLKAKVTQAAQSELVKIKHSEMKIPLGAFTGLSLISNYGPEIGLTFCLTGSFTSRIESSFESAGNNQTIHHIKLILTSKIVTASVDYDGEMEFDTDFEIAQSIIIGDIPTTYGGYYVPYQ